MKQEEKLSQKDSVPHGQGLENTNNAAQVGVSEGPTTTDVSMPPDQTRPMPESTEEAYENIYAPGSLSSDETKIELMRKMKEHRERDR